METDANGSGLKEPQRSKSIYLVSHMIKSSWLFAPSPNHQMCLLLPRVCFIQGASRDFFWKDLGQFKSLWESILASISRKTRSVLRSRFSTALWPPFGTAFWDFWCSRPPQKEPLLEALSVHVAIQRRPEVENWGFWGGLVAESFLQRFCTIFGGVLDSENVDFAWEG